MIKPLEDFKREEWRPIKEYEHYYEVSSLGNVRSLSRKTLGRWGGLKTSPSMTFKKHRMKNGYLRVDLCKDGVNKHNLVHRLVAEAFIPNDDNKETVNHINCDRADNRVENLEWCTHKENSAHGSKLGRIGVKYIPLSPTCGKGHVFADGNSYIAPNGFRNCRACRRDQARRRRQRAKTLLGGEKWEQ